MLLLLLKGVLRSRWLRHAANLLFSIYGATTGLLVGIVFAIVYGPDFAKDVDNAARNDLTKDFLLTLVAAFAGTIGAQFIAEWNSRRKEKLSELRAANAAIVLAFEIAHIYLLVKKQAIQGIVEEYKTSRLLFACHEVAQRFNGLPQNTVFQYQVQINLTYPPFSPIQQLEKVLLERLSSDERNVFILTSLIQSIDGFAQSCRERNDWIAEYKAIGEENQVLKAFLLFGMRQPSGRTDDRYPQMIKQMEMQTDDCIGFGGILVEKLIRYAKNAREEFNAEFGPGAPRIPTPTFHSAVKHLLPDATYYDRWKREVYPEDAT